MNATTPRRPWTARWRQWPSGLYPCEQATLRRTAAANRRKGETIGAAVRRLMANCCISTTHGLAIGFNMPVDYSYPVYRQGGRRISEWNMPRESRIWLQLEEEKVLTYYNSLGLTE
jgi:hypothetical protein